jgi:hypothetical protein
MNGVGVGKWVFLGGEGLESFENELRDFDQEVMF